MFKNAFSSIATTVAKVAFTLTLITTITSNGTAMLSDFAAKDFDQQVACLTNFDANKFGRELFGADDNEVVATVFNVVENLNETDLAEIADGSASDVSGVLASAIASANE